jgi:exonuclease VII large subunit
VVASPPRQESGRNGGATDKQDEVNKQEALTRQAVEQCQRNRPRIQSLMANLRREERDLAAVKQDRYVPTPAPRKPFDEETESRFRPEDQELDRQRHEAAVAEWESREASRRRQWQTAHRERIDRAQAQLNRTARQLRELEPSLFTAPQSIEFAPVVARRVTRCDPEELSSAAARPR